MRISLGPAPLNWGEKKLFDFYETAITGKVDIFYLGEVICCERLRKFKNLLLNLARMIKDSNKKLYISSYALVTKLEDHQDIKELLQIADGIELNCFSYLDIDFRGDLIAGPFLNIYNSPSIEFLSKLGFKRVVLPYELSLESIKDIAYKSNLEIEAFVSGRLPLAISRRCYTLRAVGKDESRCKMTCLQYPEGLALETLDGTKLFRVNGKEVSSYEIHSSKDRIKEIEDAGVSILRIMPQTEGIGL
jgi:collagenase-like PrtC family protease